MPRFTGLLGAILASLISGSAWGANCDDGGKAGGYETSSLTAEAASRETPYLDAQNALRMLNEAAKILKTDYMNPEYRAAYAQRQSEVHAAQAQLDRFVRQQAMIASEVSRLRQMLTAEIDVNAGVRNATGPAPAGENGGQKTSARPVIVTASGVSALPIDAGSPAAPAVSAERSPARGTTAVATAVSEAADDNRDAPDFGAFVAGPPPARNTLRGAQRETAEDRHDTDRSADRSLASDTTLSITRSPTDVHQRGIRVSADPEGNAGRAPASIGETVQASWSASPEMTNRIWALGLGMVGLLSLGFIWASHRRAFPVLAGGLSPMPGKETGGTALQLREETESPHRDDLSIEKNPFAPGWVLVKTSADRGKRMVALVRPGSVVRGSRLTGFPVNRRFRLDDSNQWQTTSEKERLVFEVDQDMLFKSA